MFYFRGLVSIFKEYKIPALLKIIKKVESVIGLYFIHAATESGLLDALEKPRTKDELIDLLSVKRIYFLDNLLDLGISLKELCYKNNCYKIKGKLSRSMLGIKNDRFVALFQSFSSFYNSAYKHYAARMRGAELGNYQSTHGELVARVSKMTEPMITRFTKDFLKNKQSIRFLEIGCGSGIHLKYAYSINPSCYGIGVEIDEAAARLAAANIKQWKLDDKFTIVHGDILEKADELKDQFDLITLYNVIYYFKKPKRIKLLKILKQKLSKKGRLAVISYMRSNGKDIIAANMSMVSSSCLNCTPMPDLQDLVNEVKKAGFTKVNKKLLLPGSTYYGFIIS